MEVRAGMRIGVLLKQMRNTVEELEKWVGISRIRINSGQVQGDRN